MSFVQTFFDLIARAALMRRALLGLAATMLAFSGPLAAASPASAKVGWSALARRVGEGESPKARQDAVAKLKKTPRLDRILLEALATPDRALALDVIAALKMEAFVPALLKRVSSDRDGMAILTLNSLLNENVTDRVLDAYVEALSPAPQGSLSPAAIVAMLEPLGRGARELSDESLAPLFAHEYPEVRSAALYYVRLMAIVHRRPTNLALAAGALDSSWFQLRSQAQYFFKEVALDRELRPFADLERAAAACRRESNRFAKEACQAVARVGIKRMPSGDGALRRRADAHEEDAFGDEQDEWFEAAAETKPRTAANSPADQVCRESYQKLYRKGVLSVRVAFGYKDARPARFVGDRHERLAFVQRLLSPCSSDEASGACGFRRDSANADLFLKDLPAVAGVSPKSQARVLVVNSSVGSDDALNRKDPFQRWKSSFAERAFLSGLERADVAFYNGHSRFGGGPDFRPPRLAKSGEVDSAAYLKNKEGLQKIRGRLRARGLKAERAGELRLLGFFSCASAQHFSEEVAFDSKAGLISSSALMHWADALDNSFASLGALLEMRCGKDFRSALRQKDRQRGSRMERFL